MYTLSITTLEQSNILYLFTCKQPGNWSKRTSVVFVRNMLYTRKDYLIFSTYNFPEQNGVCKVCFLNYIKIEYGILFQMSNDPSLCFFSLIKAYVPYYLLTDKILFYITILFIFYYHKTCVSPIFIWSLQ